MKTQTVWEGLNITTLIKYEWNAWYCDHVITVRPKPETLLHMSQIDKNTLLEKHFNLVKL